jgi:hypothetical protein
VDYSLDAPPPAAVSYGLDAPSGVNPLTPEKSKRVQYAGYWWTRHPDGRMEWCLECNGPYPAAGVPGMVVVDWNGYKPAVSGVAAPPFIPGGIPGSIPTSVGGAGTSSGTATGAVRGIPTTGAPGVVPVRGLPSTAGGNWCPPSG